MTHRFFIFIVTLFSAAAHAQQPTAAVWLDKLEARGKEIRSLSADIVYDKNNQLIADQQTRLGNVHYLAADPATKQPTRFAVEFRQLLVGEALRKEAVDYIFDGTWLVERDEKTRRFNKRQIVKPGEVMDPLQLDGPFPLPLGQKSADVLARFDVTVVPLAEGDPEPLKPGDKPLHLRLTPRADAPKTGSKQFETIDVWYDRAELVPIKVVAVEGGEVTSVTLSGVKINEATEAELKARFDTTPPAEGWHVEIKPYEGR